VPAIGLFPLNLPPTFTSCRAFSPIRFSCFAILAATYALAIKEFINFGVASVPKEFFKSFNALSASSLPAYVN